MHHDGVVVTVDVRVHAVESLEDLADGAGEGFGEGDADAGGEGGFVVDERLRPGQEVLDVFGRGHLGGFGEAGGGVLPEVFESGGRLAGGERDGGWVCTHSSVAFISGHDCGEQNSVMEP